MTWSNSSLSLSSIEHQHSSIAVVAQDRRKCKRLKEKFQNARFRAFVDHHRESELRKGESEPEQRRRSASEVVRVVEVRGFDSRRHRGIGWGGRVHGGTSRGCEKVRLGLIG